MGMVASAILFSWGLVAQGQGGQDSAANYTNWVHHGHRGDMEFDRWSLEAVGSNGWAGHYLGESAPFAGNIDTSGRSFAMYAQPTGSGAYAAARRRWAKPALATGDRLSFQIAVNFRNGNKGFDLRDLDGNSIWNFDVRSGGYRIGGTDLDSLGPYDSNTAFTFTFTQRERRVDYTIERSGGVQRTVSGTIPAASRTVGDVRFYISGTESNDGRNNLFINNFTLDYARPGDAPLTLGERRMPGWEPSYFLRFSDPDASSVTFRHAGDWDTSHPLQRVNGVWQLDIRTVGLAPGWHSFKFRPNSQYESGPNRRLYIDPQGRIAKPPAIYLGWQSDPTATMTVHWLGQGGENSHVAYRRAGTDTWSQTTGFVRPFPLSERTIHITELTGLQPDTMYEFTVAEDPTVRRFRTMPAQLDRPVRFIVGGDRDYGADADMMTVMVASQNPDFVVIGGDILNSDNHAEEYWQWYRVVETWMRQAVRSDGSLIPLVACIGNHDMRNYFTDSHPDFEATTAWRERVAPHFYNIFSFPGHPGYGVLEFGDYLSLIILDSDHTNQIPGQQTQWLASQLQARRHFPNIIPVYHVPAYPAHRSFSDARNAQIRNNWVPLFEQAGMRLSFEHHDHTFKRTKPLLGGQENPDGIVFLGDGGWGMGLRAPDPSRAYLAETAARRHVYLVTLTRNSRQVQGVGSDSQTFTTLVQPPDGLPLQPEPELTGLTPSSLTLTWSNVPNALNYRVFRNGLLWTTTSGTSLTDPSWTPSSPATYEIVALNRAGESASPAAGAAPRQIWALTNNLPWDGSGDGDMLADPNHNGRPNILEYLHGLNPRVATGINPLRTAIDPTSGNLVLRFRRNRAATDVQERVVWKSSLDGEGAWSPQGVTTHLEGADPEETGIDWFRAEVPVGEGEAEKFLRLEVTQ